MRFGGVKDLSPLGWGGGKQIRSSSSLLRSDQRAQHGTSFQNVSNTSMPHLQQSSETAGASTLQTRKSISPNRIRKNDPTRKPNQPSKWRHKKYPGTTDPGRVLSFQKCGYVLGIE